MPHSGLSDQQWCIQHDIYPKPFYNRVKWLRNNLVPIFHYRSCWINCSCETGSGKTYLACALAMEALKQYITVKHVRMSDFLLECAVTWDESRYDKVLQAYAKPKFLIIDE